MTASACAGQETGALLQVVPVTVHGKKSPYQTYALLDSGSETSFFTENLLTKLEVPGERTKLRLRTVDGDSREKPATKLQLPVSATDDPTRIMVPEDGRYRRSKSTDHE